MDAIPVRDALPEFMIIPADPNDWDADMMAFMQQQDIDIENFMEEHMESATQYYPPAPEPTRVNRRFRRPVARGPPTNLIE